jgi:hypothetical protein
MIIQTILLDLSGAVWTDAASNVSRLDPSGADQTDAENPTRNREVEGSNPSSGSKTAGQRASRALPTAQRQQAVIPLDWTSRRRRIGPTSLCRCSSGIYPALWMGLLRRPTTGEIMKTDDWAGPAGRARIRAHPRNPDCGYAAISMFIDRYVFAGCPAQAGLRLAGLKGLELSMLPTP